MTDHEPDVQATIDMLVEVGMVEEYVHEDGKPALRLTPKGERVARQLAMTDEDGAAVLLDALLETNES